MKVANCTLQSVATAIDHRGAAVPAASAATMP